MTKLYIKHLSEKVGAIFMQSIRRVNMAMTEFEKKMLQEVKGINKELHELNRTLKKEPAEPVAEVEIGGYSLAKSMELSRTASVANMVRGDIQF